MAAAVPAPSLIMVAAPGSAGPTGTVERVVIDDEALYGRLAGVC